VVKVNDGVNVEVDDAVAGVGKEKREEAGVDVTLDVVVTVGIVENGNVDGAGAVAFVVAALAEGVGNEKREPDGAVTVFVVVAAVAPANGKRDEVDAFAAVPTGAADRLFEEKRDEEEKPAEPGAVVVVGAAPKESGAVLLVPNCVVVEGPAPNENEELVVFGTEATVVAGIEPKESVEG
jgi:translation initiation factor IF-2